MDEQMISSMRQDGHALGPAAAAERADRLEQIGFRRAPRAEYALMTGCFLPSLVPAGMKAFRLLLEHLDVDYTLVPREQCCGNLLLLGASRDATGAEMLRADEVARESLDRNLEQARMAGAKKVIAFCAGCDLVYDRFRSSVPEEILWYPTFMARLFRGGRLDAEVDYYAGCYYHHRKLNRSYPDLDSALTVLQRIEGLKINILDNRRCCNRPDQLSWLLDQMKTSLVVTPCAGCTTALEKALAGTGRSVAMLPEVLWAASGGTLQHSAT